MRADYITAFSKSLENLRIETVPDPVVTSGEAKVKIRAASITPPSDVKNVQGKMEGTILPRIPGRDFAGIVVDGPTNLSGTEVWGTGGDVGFTRDQVTRRIHCSSGGSSYPQATQFKLRAGCLRGRKFRNRVSGTGDSRQAATWRNSAGHRRWRRRWVRRIATRAELERAADCCRPHAFRGRSFRPIGPHGLSRYESGSAWRCRASAYQWCRRRRCLRLRRRRALRAGTIDPETIGAPRCYHIRRNAASELRSDEFFPPSFESIRGRFACAHGYRILEIAGRDSARVRVWTIAAIAHLQARNAGRGQ